MGSMSIRTDEALIARLYIKNMLITKKQRKALDLSMGYKLQRFYSQNIKVYKIIGFPFLFRVKYFKSKKVVSTQASKAIQRKPNYSCGRM